MHILYFIKLTKLEQETDPNYVHQFIELLGIFFLDTIAVIEIS